MQLEPTATVTDEELQELAGDPSTEPGGAARIVHGKKRGPTVPDGFRLADSGVWQTGEADKPDTWVCAKLEVLALTRDGKGESWGRLLQWSDSDGRLHSWAMPATVLAGDGSELRARLLDGGLKLGTGRKAREALVRYLAESEPAARTRCALRTGWHSEGTFVLPDITIGPGEEEIVFQSEGDSLLRQSGTLEEWKETIGKYCVGNSRLVFAVSGALAGPLLHLCDEQSGGFHFVSPSSTGKSSALQVAGSVLGGGGKAGFCQSWRATSNGLEAVAEAHNDVTLILDELSQCDPKEAGEVGYMLANGSGKSRMRAAGGLRRRAAWRLLFLSAGEISLADHLSGIGRKTRGGQEVRLLNLPADAGASLGCFEQLHGFPSADSFARHLQEASKRTYGAPIRHFLDFVTRNRERVTGDLGRVRKAFIDTHVPPGASGEVSRAAGRFSVVAAAGELAIEAGVLPWSEDTTIEAVGRLFKEWLAGRGTSGAVDIEAGVRQVRLFIELHGLSRFEGSTERPVINRAGYVRKNDQGAVEYLILPEVFRSEVCRGFSAPAIAKALLDRGLLEPGGEGRLISRRRVAPETTVGVDNRVSVYVIREDILR